LFKRLKDFRYGAGAHVTVVDPVDSSISYVFPVTNHRTVKRVKKMGSKEPGTINWLNETLRADDIFLDIGANVGVYTVFAATRVPQGKIYAFEPHASNFAMLLETIQLNNIEDRVIPLSVPLNSSREWIDFSYHDLLEGSSGSQLTSSPTYEEGIKAVSEKKLAHTVDDLIETGVIESPSVIKIDVDGNELSILKGMTTLLAGDDVRSIQIEIDEIIEHGILEFMARLGYRDPLKHHSARGAKVAATNVEKISFPYNAVFSKSD
jgi:FkbM family methyltransferase